jgi:hypothetical protein
MILRKKIQLLIGQKIETLLERGDALKENGLDFACREILSKT